MGLFRKYGWECIALAVVISTIWAVLAGFFNAASDNVKAASITALVTVSVFTVGRYLEQRRDARQRLNVEKIEVYKRFFNFYFDVFTYEKIHGEKMAAEKILVDMVEFQKDVVLWGSDAVIKEYLEFKDHLNVFSSKSQGASEEQNAKDIVEVFRSTARLLSAMRRDVGYTFTSFSAKDLARLQLAGEDEGAITLKQLGHKSKE